MKRVSPYVRRRLNLVIVREIELRLHFYFNGRLVNTDRFEHAVISPRYNSVSRLFYIFLERFKR